MRVLFIEGEASSKFCMKLKLGRENFEIEVAVTGRGGLEAAKARCYDLIIVDLKLPDISGHEVLRLLRGAGNNTPLMILSENNDTENKLKGFSFGADDYVIKPFVYEEFIARMKAIVRRSRGVAQSIIRTGKIVINLDTKTTEVSGRAVNLTIKEYQILEILSLRKGTTITKEMLSNHLYGGPDEPDLNIINVFICKLRRKLSDATGGLNYIETIWGRGYVLRDPNFATIKRHASRTVA
ncbi:response regulator transcription factor [uncultured Roseovarius sp.]|uniref:response regulator transcription factor n=1 Tax=uncultured Roseovarius sp. TaxID=293344 RepID=UPI002629E79C|nr:response regulator transcription factor [uncultured Roseovarius sp.]